ncbi:MAG: alpha/beta fold hydrolase [Burkholderiales bacterium]
MPKVAIADGEIYYEEAGRGEPLIFVSGLGGTGSYWRPQVPAFNSRYRVITYDHRGTGASDRLQRVFSIDQMTTELALLMDALGIGSAHIVGWSTGGAIGQTLAIEQPQRIARLVLCSTWTHCDPWFRRLFEARREVLRQGGSALYAEFYPLWVYPPEYVNAHDAAIEAERRQAAAGAPPVEVAMGRINALLAFDRRAGLPHIQVPTLVVASDNDYVIPSYHAEALARAIPGARLAILRGGGHANTATRPEEFNRIVLEFLSG